MVTAGGIVNRMVSSLITSIQSKQKEIHVFFTSLKVITHSSVHGFDISIIKSIIQNNSQNN